jgi:hypothetical protein
MKPLAIPPGDQKAVAKWPVISHLARDKNRSAAYRVICKQDFLSATTYGDEMRIFNNYFLLAAIAR